MTYNQVLISNIREIIKKNGIKQCIVAERSGLKAQSLSDMLNGRKIITAEHVPILAHALGVEVNELYRQNEQSISQKTA